MKYNQCPIMRTLEVIGGKWKPILLHYLAEEPRRAGELLRLVPQASGKVLTEQLRELERDGIITRKVHSQVPPRVDYALSDHGRSLLPVLDAMCAWGREHPQEGEEQSSFESLAKRSATEAAYSA
jgi:DNA-binding HxlR family transcriptional regulator